jgi:uncharacterized Zn-binding protein involved in type VI secretion
MADSFNSKGSVLLMVLYILVILSVLSVTALSVININFLLMNNENKYQQVYYITEAGAHKALEELHLAAFEAYTEIIREYNYQPLISPSYSLHEDHNDFVLKKMYQALRKVLDKRGYLATREILQGKFPEGNVNVSMQIVGQGISFTRMLIIVRGSIGNIERRIDIQLKVNHKSLLVDSLLFNKTIIAGNAGMQIPGGDLTVHGNLYTTGNVRLDNGSLNIYGDLDVGCIIHLDNNSTLTANRDVTSLSLIASGEAGSYARIEGDANISQLIQATNWGNSITCMGNVVVAGLPSPDGHIGGILALEGGLLQIEGDVFVNTVISYRREDLPLFGLEELLPEDGSFISGESIGGNNHSFYFIPAPDPYINSLFNETYLEYDTDIKALRLIDYLENPPSDGDETEDAYYNHINCFDASGVILMNDNSRGYARGVVLANGRASLKRDMNYFLDEGYDTPDEYFMDMQKYIAERTAWDYRLHINKIANLQPYNAIVTSIPEGKVLSAVDSEKPLLLVNRNNEQLFLDCGNYKGIIYTEGAVRVNRGVSVEFSGLIIAEGGMIIEGELEVIENRDLVLLMIEDLGGPLQEFFKIYIEPSLITVTSFKEVLPNLRY